jgi:glucosylceramidase
VDEYASSATDPELVPDRAQASVDGSRQARALRLVRLVRSSSAGERLAEIGSLASDNSSDPARASVFVDPGKHFQTFKGFGGAFTEAAAVTFAGLPSAQQEEVLTAYFDAEGGHGYRFCRTHINSCDFSAEEYAYADPGDLELVNFSVEHDRQLLIPFIQAADRVAGGELRLLASPWSPPGWMKTTGQMREGGKVLPELRDVWATYYCRYIRDYERDGIRIWGVSVQNEPEATQRWESCRYTAEEERDFVRDHLGPTLQREGLGDVAIVIWDHNRDRIVERATVVLNDPEAARFVWGTGFHWYDGDNFENVALVHEAFPDKKLLLTEACQEDGTHHGSWELAERYARAIVNDLNHWAVGWIDWNLLLDETGGPNHAGNYCSAPIIADRQIGQLHYESSYAAIGQFARYIRPGSRRVLCSSSLDDLEATAFDNGRGGLTIVALNRSENAISFDLRAPEEVAKLESPAHSISTLLVSGAPW